MDQTLPGTLRHDWTLAEVAVAVRDALHGSAVPRPARAPAVPRGQHGADEHAASIKTGACPRGLCVLLAERALRHRARSETLLEIEQVVESARRAKEAGATRFCMGAAYRFAQAKTGGGDRADDSGSAARSAWSLAQTLGMLSAVDRRWELKRRGLDY